MKEVFKQSKGDIKLFIQYQNSLSISITIPFVPKMITEAFNALIKLKKINLIPTITIFQALNGSLPFSNQMDSCLQIIINSINRGNWESLFRCGDIVLISELLFVWFDESVKCCINPNRINNLFNEDIIKSSNSLAEQYHDDDDDPHHNGDDKTVCRSFYSIKVIEEIDKVTQKHLRKYEYETLLYIANFIERIKFGVDSDNYNDEERHMIEKLSTFLLGYNIKLLYDNTTKTQEYYSSIHKLNNLIAYLQRTERIKRKDKEINIKKAVTVSQKNALNNRPQMITAMDLNKQIGAEQEEELFNYYLLLQDHFENQSSPQNPQSKNAMPTAQISKAPVKFDIQTQSENENQIIRDYTMKNEVFKASALDIVSSNGKESGDGNDNQSYRNKIRTTKQLTLFQSNNNKDKMSIDNNNEDSGEIISKKLWIKEEDC